MKNQNNTNTERELKKIFRFLEHKVSKYIFMVIDDERILNYLVILIQIELKKKKKEILNLKLSIENVSVYRQVRDFLGKNECYGLIITNFNSLIYKYSNDCIDQLNKSRDAFEKFHLPIVFVINKDNLTKIINGASDFYQLRDLPDFHFEGSMVEDRDFLDISFRNQDNLTDSELKASLLEEQLKIVTKEKKIDKGALNHIVAPLLDIYFSREDFKKMKALFNKYLKGKENVIENKGTMGNYYYSIYDFEKALSYYQEALDYYKKSKDKWGESSTLHQMGVIYQNQSRYNDALKQYEQALEINKKIGDTRGIAASLYQTGIIYEHQGRYNDALRKFEQTLKYTKKIGDTMGMVRSFHQIGTIYELQGRYEDALKKYEKAFEVAEKIGYTKGIGAILHQIGRINEEKGRYDDALRYYERSRKIFEETGVQKELAASLHQIGMIFEKKGRYDDALGQYEQSFKVSEEIGDVYGTGKSMAQIGQLYFKQNKYKTALKMFIQAFLIFDKLGSPYANRAKNHIVRVRKKMPEAQFNEILKEFNLTPDIFIDLAIEKNYPLNHSLLMR